MEVAMALGIISFALVGLVGVFPLGLENGRMSVAETRAAQLTKVVFSTLATEASIVTGPPPANGIRCFSTTLGPLDLPADGTIYDESANVPGVTAKLYASYDALGQPGISRDPGAAAGAIYQLDLTFQPRTFSYLAPPSVSGGSSKAKKRVMGYDVRLRVVGLNRTNTFFETSSFVPSFQRAAYAR
jgi:hypothetical protein